MDVKGKLAIITGSGMGLGKAFATKLLEAGAMVCISDVDEATGEKTTLEFAEKFGNNRVHFIKCNVLEKDDIVNLYEGCEKHFGRSVDIFCNNAGINHVRGWRLCMDIDIMAVMECAEYVIDKMDKRKGGKGGLIVNTASLAGIVVGWNRESACYFVAKHGVVVLTRTLGTSKLLKETGVKVQCICPSFADTNILADIGTQAFSGPISDVGGMQGFLINKIPILKAAVEKKFGLMTPEYVAEGFMKLVTKCNTGDAICIVKDVPPFIYNDMSKEFVMFLGIGAKLFKAAFGVELFTPQHQMAFFLMVFILANVLLHFLTSFLF